MQTICSRNYPEQKHIVGKEKRNYPERPGEKWGGS